MNKDLDKWWEETGREMFDKYYTDEMADNYTDIGGDIQKWFSNKVKFKIDDMKKQAERHSKSKQKQIKTNMITELRRIVETELQPTAPFSVEADDVWGGYIRIQYDLQSGTTTEGVEEIMKVLQAELHGWEYIMKHEEFYWADGAWENKYDKK